MREASPPPKLADTLRPLLHLPGCNASSIWRTASACEIPVATSDASTWPRVQQDAVQLPHAVLLLHSRISLADEHKSIRNWAERFFWRL